MNGKTVTSAVYLTIFAIITVILTYILAVTITNGGVGASNTYKAQFSDATGLLKGDDVRIAGVRVGQIKNVTLKDTCKNPQTGAQSACAEVTFGLLKAYPMHTSAHAALKYRNLVGQRYLQVEDAPGGDAMAPKNYLLGLDKTTPALDLTELFDGFRPLFTALTPAQVNQVSYEIVQTLQGEGGTFESLLSNTASLTTSIASQDAAIGSLIDNLSGVLGTVDNRSGQLVDLVQQLQQLVTGLAGDRNAIAASLANVDKLATSSTTLVQAIRPSLPTDLAKLSAVTNTLATSTSNLYCPIAKQGKCPQTNQLQAFLQHLPTKLNSIVATAGYGSYFNFYACTLDVSLGAAAPVSSPVDVQIKSKNPSACKAGG